MTPWRFTYWELVQRVEAVTDDAWQHTAWLSYTNAMAHGTSKGRKLKPADFNPLELARAAEREKSLAATVRELGKTMPKTLTEAEIERRFQQHKEQSRG